ncbi:MAG: flagellar motor protein MotB [Methylotenera sp.]|nr:flagellar motor protein MotB [Oligoflexia bacterium]
MSSEGTGGKSGKARGSRRGGEESASHERWLVSYADFITLLFALFVVLYASSQANLEKLKQVSQGMKAAFAGEKIPAGASGKSDVRGAGTGPGVGSGAGIGPGAGSDPSADSPFPGMQNSIESQVHELMPDTAVSDVMEFESNPQGLVIKILAAQFFMPGEAEVNPDLRPLLDRIGATLMKAGKPVQIAGHADSEDSAWLIAHPEGRQKNTWELSAARAAWVAQHWMKRLDWDPEQLSVTAFSRYRPLTSSSEAVLAGQAKRIGPKGSQRRIEILLMNPRPQSDVAPVTRPVNPSLPSGIHSLQPRTK